jgi:hypothetical protein
MIKRAFYGLLGSLSCLLPQVALANEPSASYGGIAAMYFSFIAIILIYGVFDVLGKTAGRIATPLILIAAYMLLPE